MEMTFREKSRYFWYRFYNKGLSAYKRIGQVMVIAVILPGIMNVVIGPFATCWFFWNYLFTQNPYDPLETHPVFSFFIALVVRFILPFFIYTFMEELSSISIFNTSMKTLMGVASGWFVAKIIYLFYPDLSFYHNAVIDYSILSLLAGIFLHDVDAQKAIGPIYKLDIMAAIPFAIAVAFVSCEIVYPFGLEVVDYKTISGFAIKCGGVACGVYYIITVIIQQLRLIAVSVELEDEDKRKEYEEKQRQEEERQKREKAKKEDDRRSQQQSSSSNAQRNRTSSASPYVYFSDCRTREEVMTRYKKLCKVFHPDEGGNEKIFTTMKSEYERIVKQNNW